MISAMSLLTFLFPRADPPPAPDPAILAAQAAEMAQLRAQLDAMGERLTDRFEFVRRELFLELRTLLGAGVQGGPAGAVQPRIVDAARVEAMRAGAGLRLNVGCGHKPDPGRINVDMRELPGVDLIAAADALPFGAGELQEIFSSHVLEHFPQDTLQRSLLPGWVRLLRPGGELRAVVPDAQAMLAAHAAGAMDFETLRLVTFGGQEYAGDFHHTMFTPESLCALFEAAGLVQVRVEARGRPNGACLECQVVGTKA
jgi:hypothetical protein